MGLLLHNFTWVLYTALPVLFITMLIFWSTGNGNPEGE